MDRSLFSSRRSASHTPRCLGPGKFTVILRRGNANHPRSLRTWKVLYEISRPSIRSLEATRSRMEAKILLSYRGALDGGSGRRLRASIATLPEGRWNQIRAADSKPAINPLAANQFRKCEVGDLRITKWISSGPRLGPGSSRSFRGRRRRISPSRGSGKKSGKQ